MGLNLAEVFALLMVALIVVLYVRASYVEVDRVVSPVDGRAYLVRNLPDKQAAADLLAVVNGRLQALVARMAEVAPEAPDVRQLVRNYSPDAVSEGTEDSGYTSYSVGKRSMVLCLRSRDGQHALVGVNLLTYVAVHELAHMMTPELDHTAGFWDNFRWLLTEAVALKLYTRVDYAAEPAKYCGIVISSSII